ncbi:hypothetical protein [Propionicimonas sp.]|uniref:hypothetical protein n=1 Tax=Propionicimonas sp. TaxID=1955623 RepID=UPI0039E314B7
MLRTRGRAALTVLAAAAALLLTGCDTSGTVEVVSADELTVDLVFTDLEPASCTPVDNSTVHVTAIPVSEGGGTVSCHVQGSVQLSALENTVSFTTIGDYAVLASDFRGIDTAGGGLDLSVVVPGEVVAASQGVVSRNSVHYVGSVAALAEDPLTVVSSTRPRPPAAVFAVGGVLVGAAATLLVVAVRRRSAAALDPVVEDAPGEGPEQPQDAAVSAEPAAPGAADQPPPPPDHSIWAPPDDD